MKKIIFFSVLVLFLAGCATQPDPEFYSSVPGFFTGLWHGVTSPFSFFISLFTDIRIYAFPNAGRWYDFGFMIGICGFARFLQETSSE